MDQRIETIREGVLDGDAPLVEGEVRAALDDGVASKTILDDGLVAAMSEVGCLFEEGEYFVPEMLVSARAMKAGLTILQPHLVAQNVEPAGRVVIGTVQGDLHDIGKNLVSMMLEGAGFEIVDLGVDVPPDKFVEAAKGVDIIALSALLTTTMPNMQRVIDALGEGGVRGDVKVMVGGAPVTQAFAEQIGADGYAKDASQAATLAKTLVA
jgi:5-methyltetrahydrofolate--homocysteine methyltransferase